MERKINHRPIFYSFLALLLGIYSARFLFNLNISFWGLVVLAVVWLVIFLCIYKKFALLLVILTVLLFGIGWFFVGVSLFEGRVFLGEQTIVGRVSDNVEYADGTTSILLKDVKINGEAEKNIRLTVFGVGENLEAGDIIEFSGVIENNALFNLGSFNLSDYRDNAPYSVSTNISNIKVTGFHLSFDESFRLKVKDMLFDAMGSRNGATAYAVLFGETIEIDEDIYNAYTDAGVLHLLAVSGLNVTFLISLIGYILKLLKVSRWTNFLTCFFILMIYCALCGFAPSIVRAGIMGIIFLWAQLSGKCYDGLNTLGFAGILTLIFSPLSALDLGFLMSYFCVLGILLIHPWLSTILRKVFPKFVADSFSISISAQVLILPFLALMYSQINILSLFANLILVPMFSFIYPVLCVCVLLCFGMPFLSFLLTLCGYVFSLIVEIATFFSQTNLLISLKPFNAVLVMLSMTLVFLLSRYFMGKKKIFALCNIALIVLTYLVFTFVPMNTSSITLTSYFNTPLILITNSHNETISINGSGTSLNSAMYLTETKTLLANIQLDERLGESERELCGVKENITHQDLSSQYPTKILENNETYTLGNFTIKFLEENEELIGLEVAFDEKRCIILRENITFIALENYDIVISSQAEVSSTALTLSLFPTQTSDYSYSTYGSFNLNLNTNILKRID